MIHTNSVKPINDLHNVNPNDVYTDIIKMLNISKSNSITQGVLNIHKEFTNSKSSSEFPLFDVLKDFNRIQFLIDVLLEKSKEEFCLVD